MFEIIMLFAFLCAATCQAFPERPVATNPPSHRKKRLGKMTSKALRPPTQKHQTSPTTLAKVKSRNHSYARAA